VPGERENHRLSLLDAADGLIEEGYVEVDDMVAALPWLDGSSAPVFPVAAR
jgi:hypothetical protein